MAKKLFSSWIFVLMLLSGSAWGQEPLAAVEGSPSVGKYILRWALLQGQRDLAESNEPASNPGGEELLDWDFRRDDRELIEIFRLASVETLQQGVHRISGAEDDFSITVGKGANRIRIEGSVVIESREDSREALRVARFAFKFFRQENLLFAPMVLALLGERAMLVNDGGPSEALICLVVQVDPVVPEMLPEKVPAD
ncbi:MAG: hypothetical protein AAF481_14275 [Acidobacteriota bacterium]